MDNYYDLLEQIHRKPGLYIGTPSISNLYMFLIGYNFSRRQLSIPLTEEERAFREFQPWLQERLKLKTSKSWSQIVLSHSADERDAFERFFTFLEEFVQQTHDRQTGEDAKELVEIA